MSKFHVSRPLVINGVAGLALAFLPLSAICAPPSSDPAPTPNAQKESNRLGAKSGPALRTVPSRKPTPAQAERAREFVEKYDADIRAGRVRGC